MQMNRARYASHRDGQKRCTGGVAQRRRQQTVTLRQRNTGGSSPPATTIRLVANRRINGSGAFKAVLRFACTQYLNDRRFDSLSGQSHWIDGERWKPGGPAERSRPEPLGRRNAFRRPAVRGRIPCHAAADTARPPDRTMACPSSRSGPMWRVRGGRRRTAGVFRHSPR